LGLQVIVGDDYVPVDKGVSAAAVLEKMVVAVVQSRDLKRLEGLATLCKDYLQAFDLAVYVFEILVGLQIETLDPMMKMFFFQRLYREDVFF
jgi:hypothetical protein